MDSKQGDKRYTYADYCTWVDEARSELIDGVRYLNEPGPATQHQSISGQLFIQIGSFLEGKPAKVFAAPFDVRLNADTGDDTVVQPDILVVCDCSILTAACCVGVPDMVVEILSPSTGSRDMVLKYNRYLSAGVKEYWIIDPGSRTVQACVLKDGAYVVSAFGENDEAPVYVLEGLIINLAKVFAL